MRIHNPTITGSLTLSGSNLNIDPSGNIVSLGSVTATEYIVSSSVTNISIATNSGSVAFGDSSDDIHQFTGSLFITGSRIGFDDGKSNIAIGKDAMANPDGASDSNIAIGTNSLDASLSAAYNNIAIGRDSLTALTQGDTNIAIGNYAGSAITTAGESTIVGYQAGSATTVTLTALGYRAGKAITSGASNLAIGYQAMLTHTTGLRNIAIGYGAIDDTDAC